MALLTAIAFQNAQTQTPATPVEARAIAKEVCIYANAPADSYRIL